MVKLTMGERVGCKGESVKPADGSPLGADREGPATAGPVPFKLPMVERVCMRFSMVVLLGWSAGLSSTATHRGTPMHGSGETWGPTMPPMLSK